MGSSSSGCASPCFEDGCSSDEASPPSQAGPPGQIEEVIALPPRGSVAPSTQARFVDMSDVQAHGCLPRYGSNFDFKHPLSGQRTAPLSRPSDSFDRQSTLFVFASHCWLTPAPGAAGHPDNSAGDKYKLLLSACESFKALLPKHFTIALWLDFCCVDQDRVPESDLLGLDAAMSLCDVMLTLVVDESHGEWEYPTHWEDAFDQYRAKGWRYYWTRAWCRVEAMLAALQPLPDGKDRANLFPQGVLHNSISLGRRPHTIFGTKESENNRPPLFLPPLLNSTLDMYDPEKGEMTITRDRDIIRALKQKALLNSPPAVEVYKGPKNANGKPEGHGTKTWPSGKLYQGEFQDGKLHGNGLCRYAHWDVYEGEWHEGLRHGEGKHIYANGDEYTGQFRGGSREGHGIYRYTSKGRNAKGGYYEGEWLGGLRHGQGKHVFANGEVFEGLFLNNVPISAYPDDTQVPVDIDQTQTARS